MYSHVYLTVWWWYCSFNQFKSLWLCYYSKDNRIFPSIKAKRFLKCCKCPGTMVVSNQITKINDTVFCHNLITTKQITNNYPCKFEPDQMFDLIEIYMVVFILYKYILVLIIIVTSNFSVKVSAGGRWKRKQWEFNWKVNSSRKLFPTVEGRG